ncbi:MAG: hypothetical protein RQM92_12485 [Candidatus Syntrophopropionicum ammoniitolerans]
MAVSMVNTRKVGKVRERKVTRMTINMPAIATRLTILVSLSTMFFISNRVALGQ